MIEAPLRPHPLAEPGCEWYDETALAALPDAIDLLLVDGPPAPPGSQLERARYPAVPVLAGRLATGATVILDDAGREGEIWVVDRWQHELGMRFERPQGERIAIGCRFRPPDQEGIRANQFERTE